MSPENGQRVLPAYGRTHKNVMMQRTPGTKNFRACKGQTLKCQQLVLREISYGFLLRCLRSRKTFNSDSIVATEWITSTMPFYFRGAKWEFSILANYNAVTMELGKDRLPTHRCYSCHSMTTTKIHEKLTILRIFGLRKVSQIRKLNKRIGRHNEFTKKKKKTEWKMHAIFIINLILDQMLGILLYFIT